MAIIKSAKTGGMSDADIELTNLSREYVEALLIEERAWNLLQGLTHGHELYHSRLDDWSRKEERTRKILKKVKEKFIALF
jgi:hypothetical protein